MAARGKSALDQVHQQEGEVVKQVAGGEDRIEFESVESDRLAVENGDIAEMKVAVAAADQALCAARGEQRTQPTIGGERLALEQIDQMACEQIAMVCETPPCSR